MDYEIVAFERSFRNDKVHDELLKVVTCAVARLQLDLDWPQEKEKVLKVGADFCLAARGRGLSDCLFLSS